MILAAGRGARLAPLTDHTPKPLLRVGREFPLARHLRRFAAAGFSRAVINLHHLGEQIRAQIGDGAGFGIAVQYSPEPRLLAAAGGIRLAMARGLLAADAPFAVANADVVCDYDVARLRRPPAADAHLILAPNPPAHPNGDFALEEGRLSDGVVNRHTYAGMGVFSPRLFAELPPSQPAELRPLLLGAIAKNRASGELHQGLWHDIGTPAALQNARQDLAARAGDGLL